MITIHIPDTVSPAGLRARADIMRGFMDESCAHHLELAAARIEQLEAALRYYATDDDPYFDRARAALAQSSPPARQENDDVFKGFRGNNEA